MPRRLLVPALTLALLAGGARGGGAQVAGQFQVVPAVGAIRFDRASALEDAPFLGLDAAYFLNSSIAVGLQFHASRPRTDGTYFPLAMLDFGDTTYLYAVSQRVTLVGAGAQVQLHQSFARFDLFVNAGGGVYRFYMDPRRAQTISRMSGPSALVGGGVNYMVSEAVGIRAEVRDVILMDFDRDALDATLSYVRNNRIPNVFPPPPEEKDVIHNLRFALGFSFVPGRVR